MIEIQSRGGESWVGISSIVDVKRVGACGHVPNSRTNFFRYISINETFRSQKEKVVSRAFNEVSDATHPKICLSVF